MFSGTSTSLDGFVLEKAHLESMAFSLLPLNYQLLSPVISTPYPVIPPLPRIVLHSLV